MNRARLAACLAAGTAMVLSCRGSAALDIVKDGKPAASIVIPERATEYHKWAAGWLQEYVEKSSGARLPILAESKAPAEGAIISVGPTDLAAKAGIKTDDLKYDGCKLSVKGNVLYLIGRDYVPPAGAKPDNAPEPYSGRPQGTVRAVATFLEDSVGVRWLLPVPEGTYIPKTTNLAVPESLDKAFSPALGYCFTAYGEPRISAYANNGRMSVKYQLYGGDATWQVCVPYKQYGTTHPEYFRMDADGKRETDYGENGESMLCTSNPEVRDIMLKKLRQILDEGKDGVELAQSDGWRPCLCPQCQKEFGDGRISPSPDHPAERIWTLHKWLIDELGKSHPDKKIIVTSYSPSRFPSKRFDSLPENAVVEFCTSSPDAPEWKLWEGKYKHCVVDDEYVWWEGCTPTGFFLCVSPQWLQDRARTWRGHGVMGAYGGGRGSVWGLGGPAYYAYAKLAGDPDLDLDKLLADYCQGLYGESAGAMERFFRLYHSRVQPAQNMPNYDNSYPAEDAFCSLFPPPVIAKLDYLLKNADELAQTDRTRLWLRYTHDCFDGLKGISLMFAAKRSFELNPTAETLATVQRQVDFVEQWRERIVGYCVKEPDYVRRCFPNYYGLCRSLIGVGDRWGEYYYKPDLLQKAVKAAAEKKLAIRGTMIGPLGYPEIVAPLTWDFQKKAADLGKPRGAPRVIATRTTAKPGPDGALDPKSWADAKPIGFERYHAADSVMDEATGTTVRLMYDDERLYAHFECREKYMANLKLKSVGRTEAMWYQDCVEVLLDPDCSPRKYMHFLAAPIKDSWFTERQGYIADPRDPHYAQPDTSWVGPFTYSFNLDKEKNVWTLDMAIPFKTLGVAAPKEGDVWTGNFTRTRRACPKPEESGEDLSCWIADEFRNPEIFGDMVFGPAAKP